MDETTYPGKDPVWHSFYLEISFYKRLVNLNVKSVDDTQI